MTGYGKATGNFQNKKVTIEVRALNSKQVDMTFRSPSCYREFEAEMRKIVSSALERGKIDVSINLEEEGSSKAITVNRSLVQAYYNDLKEVNEMIGEKSLDYLSVIMRMPEVLSSDKEEMTKEEKAWLMNLLKESNDKLSEFRAQEGKALEKDFTDNIEGIRDLLNAIEAYEPDRVETIRQRLTKQLEEIKNGVYDNNRMEQELIFYMEKFDVSEEKMRLTNHLDYFLETMTKSASGRKLGFISQEIGREINTLGSKSNHAEMQKLVVEMKDRLEKIKEQVLNTL
jgi:uncharacterized protein (TIGR00255 family)